MQECGRYERITDLFKQRVAVISRSLCPGAILIIGLVETFESVIYLADYQRYHRSTQNSRDRLFASVNLRAIRAMSRSGIVRARARARDPNERSSVLAISIHPSERRNARLIDR